MAWPYTPLNTYVANNVPAIKAADLNAMQARINDLSFASFLWGDGSYGAYTLDGSVAAPAWATKSGTEYTLTEDVFLNSLVLTSTCSIRTAGYRIFVNGTLNIGASAKIHANGRNGSGNTAGGSSGAGSLAFGGGGGTGGTTGSQNGQAGSNVTLGLGSGGGAGGAGTAIGGGGSAGTGGSSGSVTRPGTTLGGWNSIRTFQSGIIEGYGSAAPAVNCVFGGSAGGGGGFGADSSGGTSNGGGAGGGGGICLISAKNIILGGTIEAKGGVGGNQVDVTGTPGLGGGGGGGGGGVVFLTYGQLTGAGSVTAAGGAGGTGGINGTAGSAGNIYSFHAVP